MIRHSLLLIFRNFKRFKTTFSINLIGLSTGLSCTLLIYLWVADELAMDKFHQKGDRLYQILERRLTAGGIWTAWSAPGPLGESLMADFPEVEHAVNTTWTTHYTLSVNQTNLQYQGMFAGAPFFQMFSYPLIRGDARQALINKNSIVISEEVAVTLFGDVENAVGKALEIDHDEVFAVTGVFRKVKQSSEAFDFVAPFEKYLEWNQWAHHWGNTGTFAFVLLREGADRNAFNNKIAGYIKEKTEQQIKHRTPFIKPYAERYLYGDYDPQGVQSGGRITYVKLFSAIAVFILLIACINFMNLSTAKASGRIKEVGIKKAIGARRTTLIMHYLAESLIMSIGSLLVAILIVDLILPKFNLITGKTLVLELDRTIMLPAVGIALFTGLVAGSYPALFLSGFNTAAILKGKLGTSAFDITARKGLVVFQFALSVVLIVSVMVVYKQVEYVQSKDLGYSKDNIIYFPLVGALDDTRQQETFLGEMKKLPGVVNASTITSDMTGHNSGTSGVYWEGKDPDDRTEFENFTVNFDMIETLGIEVAEGRTFSKAFSTDTAGIIFNETGIRFMGIEDPIGKTVKLWGEERKIIGVVRDFHFESLHKKVNPAFFNLNPRNTWLMMGKVKAGREQETIEAIEELYQTLNPGFPFSYDFLDQEYARLYAAEQRVSTLSRYFAALAILISCLGLLGLAAFSAEQRIKEIGIRKVLGSSEMGIVYLLSAEFTRLVFIAIVIALPVSFLLAKNWLSHFEFRRDPEWWYFVLAGSIALLVAWVTVGTQAFSAARVNPVKCLRDE